MGTIPEAKRTVTEMVPQPEPAGSFASRDSRAGENSKTTLDSVSGAEELPGSLSLKKNDAVVKKSTDNSQPDKRRASNTLTSPTGDRDKSTPTPSAVAKEKSTFSSTTEYHKKSTFTPSTRDHEKSTFSPSTKDHEKSTFTPSTRDHEKSTFSPSTRDHEKSTFSPSTRDHEKSTFSPSTRDHEKSTFSPSTRDHEKSTFSPSTRDHEKSTFSPSTRDHEKSTFSPSTRDHEKSTYASSAVDHKKPDLSSRKDVGKGRDLVGGYMSDVIGHHKDSGVSVRVLPAAEREDICKTGLPVSALTSNLQCNDAGGTVQSSTEALVQLREGCAKSAPEYSQPPCYKTNMTLRSEQAFRPTRTSPLPPTAAKEKMAAGRTSCEDASPAAQSKDYNESAVSLACVSPGSPVQTGNQPISQQEKCENLKSQEVEGTSRTPAPAGEGLSPQRKEVGPSESASRNHPSVLPQSPSPGESGGVLTGGGASEHPDAAAEEDRQARQGRGSRYREAATMTVSAEHGSTSERRRQDAGVQAVASVSSRSVGTSPSLWSQGAPLKPDGAAREGQEMLTVTCQRSSRSAAVYQITMDDGWSNQSGITSDVCSQTVLSTQMPGESSHLTGKPICDLLPGQARLKSGQCNSQTAGVNLNSDPALKPDGSGQGSVPKEPADTAQKRLPLLQPVYQINIEPCGQSNVTPDTGPFDEEPPLPDSTCQRKSVTESGSGRDRGERVRFPGNAMPNDARQASVDAVDLPARPAGSPATRSSPAQPDSLLPGAPTRVTEEEEEGANPPVSGRQAAGRLKEDPKRHAPLKEGGHACKSGQSENRGRKKESERGKTKRDEAADEKKRSQSARDADRKDKAKSVHDVVWDEQGMTWEVYGASADPESLGFAIQNHLQSKIKEQERLIKAQVERRRSGAPASPAGKRTRRRRPNLFRSVMKNIRQPNCCARPPPSSASE